MGKGTTDQLFLKGGGGGRIRGGGGVRFIFLYHMGGSLLKYKMKGGGLHFFLLY